LTDPSRKRQRHESGKKVRTPDIPKNQAGKRLRGPKGWRGGLWTPKKKATPKSWVLPGGKGVLQLPQRNNKRTSSQETRALTTRTAAG